MLTTRGWLRRRMLLGIGLGLVMGSLPHRALSDAISEADDDPIQFVQSLGRQAIALLSDTKLAPEDRRRVFRELLIDRFDMPSIARLVLGKHWRRASVAQKDAFKPLFQEYIVVTYASRFDAYSGEQLIVGSARQASKKVIAVGSEVRRSGGSPIAVDWMLHRPDGRWSVVDVTIEGVSMVISQRTEFNSVISNQGGIDGLIESIRNKIEIVSFD